MRVELIYAPGCNTYKKALDVLETVIAEERLPIPVELNEQACHSLAPVIKIDGSELGEHAHDAPCAQLAASKLVGNGLPCVEHLRNLISTRWSELTGMVT